jgi:hypothetical protein
LLIHIREIVLIHEENLMSEEKTVYVVTSGEYSNYHIDAIFSNRAAADAYCERHNRVDRWYDKKDVEEWALDGVTVVDNSKIIFTVSYTISPEFFTRHMEGRWYCSADPDQADANEEVVYSEEPYRVSWRQDEVGHRWATEVWADTEEEAKKIGADRIMAAAGSSIQGDEPFAPGPFDALERRDTPFLNAVKPAVVNSKWGAKNLATGEVYKPSDPPTPEEAAIDEEVRKMR